ncbi:hypothetical protein F5Y02DRAFT_422967 [Annulohypoxylon stygium]|nr:hypothetical protein F5Y02DRAFT_422967 [Annulohypoxylon stygium]
MQAQGSQDVTGTNYVVSPVELEKPNVQGIPEIPDMQAPAPYQLLTPASIAEELLNDFNESDFSDMTYNSQGQNGQSSLDPIPLDNTITSSTPAAIPSTSQPQSQSKCKKERNRKAAHKCRQKSKANIEQLKKKEQELSQRNQELKDAAYGLRNEVLCLKNEVLMHGATCDNGPIQSYLSRVVNGLTNREPT